MSESNHYMIGRRVIVLWNDEAYNAGCDWVAFRILDCSEEGYWCQGVDSPCGAPHDGSKVFIKMDQFHDMITWKEEA